MRKLGWIFLLCSVLAFGEKLSPVGPGVPADLTGEVWVDQQDGLLWLKARVAEPGGKVLARSIGRNPVWEKDTFESPPLEDRVRWTLDYRGSGTQRSIVIEVNPWGAYRIEEGGRVLRNIEIATTTDVTESGWSADAAVPVASLEPDWSAPQVRLRAERIRPRRALAPGFRWQAALEPVTIERADEARLPDLPNRFGNTDPPLEIGRLDRLPPLDTDWDHPDWQAVPSFDLPRNEPYPRAPWHRTQVRWVHDGATLAILARMDEPEPVVAQRAGRDSAVGSDDHLSVYLAATGSKFIQITTNTVGALLDTLGSGPRTMRPHSSWNGNIERMADIRHGYWIVALRIPLDECAEALDESGVPRQWRILLSRHRAARPGEPAENSTLPAMGGVTSFHGPARYRAMVLHNQAPSRVQLPQTGLARTPATGLTGELAGLAPHVWTPLYRRYHSVRTMVQDYLRAKVRKAVLAERQAWEKVDSRTDWERFRDERIQAFRDTLGEFPPERPPLAARVTTTHSGKGYRQENLVWQSRPGLWMAANLYLPADLSSPVPAIMIVPSQHYPKTHIELHDMGELWARAGAAVLIIERLGYGERTETSPWFRQGYGARFNFTKQLFVAGENYSAWLAWDVMRSVDFLYERPEIDRDQIILMGAVAGGGEIAGVAAALDPRIAAVVPFNYDQGHVRVQGDSPGQIAGQFSPWLISASIAPRKFVRAFEFGWEGAEEPDYPSLWVDGMERSQKVWGFYGAEENLAAAGGYGLIRLNSERTSPCSNIGPQHRETLYPILRRWFGIPYPDDEARSILPHSQLTSPNPVREAARKQEASRRRPDSTFLSIPPAVSAELNRRPMHVLAYEMGVEQLKAARNLRQPLQPDARTAQLRDSLKPVLGDIDPLPNIQVDSLWRRPLSGAVVEGLSVQVEEGIDVPVLFIRPAGDAAVPVVVAVAQAGKERFLTDRFNEIASLLEAGIAVCLPDLRATGETAPTRARGDGGTYQWIAQTEFDLGRSLLGSRLKDLRSVLAYLRQRPDVAPGRLALWGDSFTPPNPKNLWLDELENEGGPQIQYRAEPMGAHLALLAALYEDDIRAVAARGGLTGYLSVAENPFTYVPTEDILLGVLKTGDIADIAAALAPRPLLIEASVNGRNIRPAQDAVDDALAITHTAYRQSGSGDRLLVRQKPGEVSTWLESQLQ